MDNAMASLSPPSKVLKQHDDIMQDIGSVDHDVNGFLDDVAAYTLLNDLPGTDVKIALEDVAREMGREKASLEHQPDGNGGCASAGTEIVRTVKFPSIAAGGAEKYRRDSQQPDVANDVQDSWLLANQSSAPTVLPIEICVQGAQDVSARQQHGAGHDMDDPRLLSMEKTFIQEAEKPAPNSATRIDQPAARRKRFPLANAALTGAQRAPSENAEDVSSLTRSAHVANTPEEAGTKNQRLKTAIRRREAVQPLLSPSDARAAADALSDAISMKPKSTKQRRVPFLEESSPEPEEPVSKLKSVGSAQRGSKRCAAKQDDGATVDSKAGAGASLHTANVVDHQHDHNLYCEPEPVSTNAIATIHPSCSTRATQSSLRTVSKQDASHEAPQSSGTDAEDHEQARQLYVELKARPSQNFCYPDVSDERTAPALSLEKLVVLAIAASPRRSLTLAQIFKYIAKTFSYYGDQDTSAESSAHPWTKNVEDILHNYDFPTICTHDPENWELNFSLQDGGEWFILKKSSGRRGNSKPFPLMKLPFELRLMIYTLVLHMPLPKNWGWQPNEEHTLNRINLYTRLDRPPSQRLTAKIPGTAWILRSPPIQQLLAITMTNHEVQAEALPVFYRTNYFYFASPKILGRFLKGMPNRQKWIRNVILNFDPPLYGHECRRSLCTLLSTTLRNLRIIVDEQELLFRHVQVEIVNVPGVKFLGELSGIVGLSFKGIYARLKKYLVEQAKILETKKKKDNEYDTDELVEDEIAQRRKDNLIGGKKDLKKQGREAAKIATQRKKEARKRAVAQRLEDRQKQVVGRAEKIRSEKDRKRRERQQQREERKARREEEAEAKKANRAAAKRARTAKHEAGREAKDLRNEKREVDRAEKRVAEQERKMMKQREAMGKIRGGRKNAATMLKGKMKGRLAATTKGKKTEMWRAVHDTTGSEDGQEDSDEDTTTSESENDGDSDVDTRKPARRAAARQGPEGRKRAATPPSSEDESSEDEEPLTKKARTQPTNHVGSTKLVAQNAKTPANATRKPMPSVATRVAMMKKTMAKNLVVRKGCPDSLLRANNTPVWTCRSAAGVLADEDEDEAEGDDF